MADGFKTLTQKDKLIQESNQEKQQLNKENQLIQEQLHEKNQTIAEFKGKVKVLKQNITEKEN